MSGSKFQVVVASEGWRLLDNGAPIFWFPEKDTALEVAGVMASARHALRGVPSWVEAQNEQGVLELVAAYE